MCLAEFEKEFRVGGKKDYLLSLCIALVYVNLAGQVKTSCNKNGVVAMVCMYVCMHVRMNVRTNACMYVCAYERTYKYMYVRTYVRMYVCMYVCMYLCYVCII